MLVHVSSVCLMRPLLWVSLGLKRCVFRATQAYLAHHPARVFRRLLENIFSKWRKSLLNTYFGPMSAPWFFSNLISNFLPKLFQTASQNIDFSQVTLYSDVQSPPRIPSECTIFVFISKNIRPSHTHPTGAPLQAPSLKISGPGPAVI